MSADEPSSEEAAGDPVRIDPVKWVDVYGDVLYRYAYPRLGDRQTAEDIVQETFLSALQGRNAFSGRASEQTWLIAILRRKIADHYRQQAREPASDFSVADPPAGSSFDGRGHWQDPVQRWRLDPAQLAEDREFWRIFEGCLDRLPAALAAAYRLREIEKLETEEICEILAISASNLWTQLYRARMRLRDCLEKNWFHPPKH